MSNTLLTIDKITKEALRLAHEKATFIGTINRQFDSSFGADSGKIGDTLRIRYPSEYVRRQGSRVMDVQDSVQVSTALVVATQDGVDMRFNSRELSLDLDSFSQLHLEPAMATLISQIESDVIVGCTKSTFNYAGTAGTAISSLTAPGAGRTRLNQNLAPKADRRVQFDSGTMASIVSGTAAYFNPSGAISEQWREGLVARTAMADYYENERVWSMANTTSVTLSTAKNNGYISTLGQTSLNITSLTVAAASVGMKFTLANVYDVHPETKQQYAQLKQFTVVGVTDVSTYTISPAIYKSGPRQNVAGNGTTTSTNALVWLGSPNSTYSLGLMYHRDAFTFATAALPLMAASEKCVRRTYDGLSLRVWQDSDIRNDELLTRIDILYGFAVIRPAWATVVVGSSA
jgi:P22 coat protein - gene protein 5